MKLRIEYLTILFSISMLFVSGCDKEKQITPEQVEHPTDVHEAVQPTQDVPLA